VQRDPTGRISPMKLATGEAESIVRFPVAPRRNPAVFASDADGCLLNSQLTGEAAMYVTGRNFRAGAALEIAVVPNQRFWSVGDAIRDVTGERGQPALERVVVDAKGQFTVKVWDKDAQRRGAYDIIAHRFDDKRERVVRADDIISYLRETG